MYDTPLVIGGKEFTSRLIVGTGKYGSLDVMRQAHEESGAEIITVAIRRVSLPSGESILDYIDTKRFTLLPNTAGCYTADEAVRTAYLAREGFVVMPYTNDDPVMAKKLEDAGAAVVMPLGAPIGSGLGIRNPYNIK